MRLRFEFGVLVMLVMLVMLGLAELSSDRV